MNILDGEVQNATSQKSIVESQNKLRKEKLFTEEKAKRKRIRKSCNGSIFKSSNSSLHSRDSLNSPVNVTACPHALPMSGGMVYGAPKLNPDIGKVVFNSVNNHEQYLRYFSFIDNKSFCKFSSFRINSVKLTTTNCNICYKLVERGKDDNSVIKDKPVAFRKASSLPGFVGESLAKKATDENLAPFGSYHPKLFQYGDTSLSSIHTDNQRWAPGMCMNLHKYEGKFLPKVCHFTKEVNQNMLLNFNTSNLIL